MAIAVLERVDRQKHHDEDGNAKERMKFLPAERALCPLHQFRHQARRVEGRRRLEHHAETLAIRPERFDVIGKRLVCAAMPVVFRGVFQQVAVKLLDVVFGEVNRIRVREHRFHDFGIARHFLLVP